jgi:hypothetical protein
MHEFSAELVYCSVLQAHSYGAVAYCNILYVA